MQIELKLFMRFKDFLPEGAVDGKTPMTLEKGTTFESLLKIIGMPVIEDKIIVINGISHKQGSTVNALQLKNNDIVAIFPPIAGG